MTKPIPAKGYVRARFVIEVSEFDPAVRQLRLASRSFVAGYLRPGGRVVFSRWLRRNTDHAQRVELISQITTGELGSIEVHLWPSAFPRIYGRQTWSRAA